MTDMIRLWPGQVPVPFPAAILIPVAPPPLHVNGLYELTAYRRIPKIVRYDSANIWVTGNDAAPSHSRPTVDPSIDGRRDDIPASCSVA